MADDVVKKSIVEFFTTLTSVGTFKTKVYLENTTKIGPCKEGSLQWILDLFHEFPMFKDQFGIVYDTEHHYAVDGEWLTIEQIKSIKDSGIDVIVHLNTVPKEVKPYSKTDRHSETTIYECAMHPWHFYKNYMDQLESLNILWVREVKEETINREISHE